MLASQRFVSSSLIRHILLRRQLALCLTAVLVSFTCTVASSRAESFAKPAGNEKLLIGPTAVVEETESDFTFPARVDTGATTSSLHVEDCKVEDDDGDMKNNVGKKIRFRIKNQRGQSEWLERKIAEISVIKTSEQEERRYKVPVTLNCLDVKKRVLVSLNDRSHMTYPVLLGRNFLQGDFVVDVALDEPQTANKEKPVRQQQPKSQSTEEGAAQPNQR